MEQLQPAYHSYLEGDEFFEKEYHDYESLKEKLKEQGYTKEQDVYKRQGESERNC